MKKFSKINESRDIKLNGYSANILMDILSKIENCNSVSMNELLFVWRSDNSDNCISLDDMIKGSTKSHISGDTHLEDEDDYAPLYVFEIFFQSPRDSDKYVDNGVESDSWCGESVSLEFAINRLKSIQKVSLNDLHDFYMRISHGKYHPDKVILELIQKDKFDREYILNMIK